MAINLYDDQIDEFDGYLDEIMDETTPLERRKEIRQEALTCAALMGYCHKPYSVEWIRLNRILNFILILTSVDYLRE